MRHFPAALLALFLLPPAANAADVPTGNMPAAPSVTADEDPLVLSPFEIRGPDDHGNWVESPSETEQAEILKARVPVIQQHLREADAIEIREVSFGDDATKDKLLWSMHDAKKVAELAQLIHIEKSVL
jgi:hypothetical protein